MADQDAPNPTNKTITCQNFHWKTLIIKKRFHLQAIHPELPQSLKPSKPSSRIFLVSRHKRTCRKLRICVKQCSETTECEHIFTGFDELWSVWGQLERMHKLFWRNFGPGLEVYGVYFVRILSEAESFYRRTQYRGDDVFPFVFKEA